MVTHRVILGECVSVMATMAADSIDAIVADPPFNWSFMGKQFDSIGSPREYQTWSETWGREALRILKPGAFAVICGGDRTFHRQVSGLEDAGFRPRTVVTHLHSQGFPKHKWSLKPAVEFWAVLQKPFKGSAEQCVTTWGTGALSIDACRVGTEPRTTHADGNHQGTSAHPMDWGKPTGYASRGRDDDYLRTDNDNPERIEGVAGYSVVKRGGGSESGRWPPNLLLSHIGGLDGCRPTGATRRVKTGTAIRHRGVGSGHIYGEGMGAKPPGTPDLGYADPDGLESIEAWDCHPQCPIFLLDEQAGERRSGKLEPHHRRHTPKGWSGPYADDNDGPAARGSFGGDAGKVSRFYPTFQSDILVDDLVFPCDNSSDERSGECYEAARNAVVSSTPSLTRCGEDSADSALASAPSRHERSATARPTLGDDLTSDTADGFASGENQGAGRSTNRQRVDGSGSNAAGQSPTVTKSIIATSTQPITKLATSNASPSNGTTGTTLDSERIMSTSTESSIDGASGVECTDLLTASPSGQPEPTTGIAKTARPFSSESGGTRTSSTSEPIAAPGTGSTGPNHPNRNSANTAGQPTSRADGALATARADAETTHPTLGPTPPDFPTFPQFQPDPPLPIEDAGLVPLPIDDPNLFPARYIPKPSRRERNCGLEGMPETARNREDWRRNINTSKQSDDGVRGDIPRANTHPTCKSVALMKWLVRLVCPPGGTLLDPFLGSGTTLMAAQLEGMNGIGIEQSEEYAEIARRRIAHVAKHGERWLEAAATAKQRTVPTASMGKKKGRKCNVCGSRYKASGPGAAWPACGHDDWSWVDELADIRAREAEPKPEPDGPEQLVLLTVAD